MIGRREFLKDLAATAAAVTGLPIERILEIAGKPQSRWMKCKDGINHLLFFDFALRESRCVHHVGQLAPKWAMFHIDYHVEPRRKSEAAEINPGPREFSLSRADAPHVPVMNNLIHPAFRFAWDLMPGHGVVFQSDLLIAVSGKIGDRVSGMVQARMV